MLSIGYNFSLILVFSLVLALIIVTKRDTCDEKVEINKIVQEAYTSVPHVLH
jgi:hypothetical protein